MKVEAQKTKRQFEQYQLLVTKKRKLTYSKKKRLYAIRKW